MDDKQIDQDVEETNPENREEKYKKLESDTERGVQKLINEKKELEAIAESHAKLVKDASYAIELSKKNPTLLKKTLDKFFDGMSVEDALKQVD